MIMESLERHVINLDHYLHNEKIVVQTLLEIHNSSVGIKMTEEEYRTRIYNTTGLAHKYHIAYKKRYNVPDHAILPARTT